MNRRAANTDPEQTRDRRQAERRQAPRIPVLLGIPMKAEVESTDRILRTVRCVNLGSHGALLDFGEGKCPNFPLESRVLVTLQLGGDMACLPAVVRHRTPDRIGVFFQPDDLAQHEEQARALSLILRTLERAVARRGQSSSTLFTHSGKALPLNRETKDPSSEKPTDRRRDERRQASRIPVLPGIPMKAEVESMDRILRTVRCVNVGLRGALLDFGEGKCPNFPLESHLLVTLELGGDIASIPAVIKHRTSDRIGVFFPDDDGVQHKEQTQALSLILRTLERAVARRQGQKKLS